MPLDSPPSATNPSATPPVVQIDQLSRRFGHKLALDDVTFHVPPGRVHGLVGANGAGKTTLLRHVLGLLRAQQGTVRVFGADPVAEPVAVLGRIGYLSEQRELVNWMRIGELLRYTAAFHPRWDEDYAQELMRTFGLNATQRVATLSKGMRAQAALIAAAAHRPDLLLLDEPSTGLDAVVRRDILNAIIRAVADGGRTVIFSSHLLDEVELMSDDVTMIHQGKIVLQGEVDRIKEAHSLIDVRFADALPTPPAISGALWIDGRDRNWSVLCDGGLPPVRQDVIGRGGEIVASRHATLQEIFVGRVGRRGETATRTDQGRED